MPVLKETEVEEFQFADRLIAAWAQRIIAEPMDHHLQLIVTGVVNEKRVPLLIVHHPTRAVRVQFDMVVWVLFTDPDGAQHTIYYWAGSSLRRCRRPWRTS